MSRCLWKLILDDEHYNQTTLQQQMQAVTLTRLFGLKNVVSQLLLTRVVDKYNYSDVKMPTSNIITAHY